MGFNIELKAQCADLESFEEKAKLLPHSLDGHDKQIDTFFKVPEGRLKLRESSLYGNFLIPYVRENESGPKRSDYDLLPVKEVNSLKRILATMFGILIVVKKERTIYLHENVRIHIDRVENLGNFIEFEAVVESESHVEKNRDKLQNLITYFGLSPDSFVQNAYAEMLMET